VSAIQPRPTPRRSPAPADRAPMPHAVQPSPNLQTAATAASSARLRCRSPAASPRNTPKAGTRAVILRRARSTACRSGPNPWHHHTSRQPDSGADPRDPARRQPADRYAGSTISREPRPRGSRRHRSARSAPVIPSPAFQVREGGRTRPTERYTCNNAAARRQPSGGARAKSKHGTGHNCTDAP